MNKTSKMPPPPDFDENPEWSDEDFANAVVVRDGVEMSPKEARLRRALEKIIEAAERRDVQACHDLAEQALSQ